MEIGKRQQILILGAGGFVGRNLTEYLSETYDVLSFARKDLNLLEPDQTAEVFQQNPAIRTVIHCAVVGGSRLTREGIPETAVVENNLRMFLNVTRCLRPDQRMIYLGSGAEYCRKHYLPKMNEEYFDSHVPLEPYAYAKYAISKLIENMPNLLCLRIFGLYGLHEDYRYKFISNSIIKNLLDIPITIAQNTMFDYLYIRDFVEIIEKLLCLDWPYRHMNVTPSNSIDLMSIANAVNSECCQTREIKILTPGWNIPYTGSNLRLLNVIGPHQFTALSTSVREMVEYYRCKLSSIDENSIREDKYLSEQIIKCTANTHE